MSEAAIGVTMTERAAQHVAGYLAKRGRGIGLRWGGRTTGCSGMAYKLEYADVAQPEDRQFESHGVKIFVDPKSLAYIDGTELDFAREGDSSHVLVTFKVNDRVWPLIRRDSRVRIQAQGWTPSPIRCACAPGPIGPFDPRDAAR